MARGDDELAGDMAGFLEEGAADRRRMARLAAGLARSARRAGTRAVVGGRWSTAVVLDLAARLPIRAETTLRTEYGRSGADLADVLVDAAAAATAGVGAAMGALATAVEATGPGVLALPLPVIADALLTALIEMKLIAELHEALGSPVGGKGAVRGMVLARAWARGHSVERDALMTGGSVLAAAAARRELVRVVRRRLLRRGGRSLTALAPVLIGAAAAAQVNRRGTRKLADAVRADLDSSCPT